MHETTNATEIAYSSYEPPRIGLRRLRNGLALGGLSLALVACGPDAHPSSSSSPEHPTASSSSAAATITPATFPLQPDMSGFLKPGTTDTCYGGGPRPCGLLLRTQPNLSSDVVNAVNKQSSVSWPLEGYGSHPADSLRSLCYVPDGGRVSSNERNLSSTVWFKVIVPESDIQNAAMLQALHSGDPKVPVDHTPDGQLATDAYGAAPWFGLTHAPTAMPQC